MAAFDERLSSSDGGDPDGFTYQHLSKKGHEFFCEIDEDYILDRFNLTGISTEVNNYQMALEMVTDTFSERTDIKDEWRTLIENNARHLYGLIHARYITTPRGMAKMVEKFNNADFGRCPRVYCNEQPLLPVGKNDICGFSSVQLYCPHCEDIYTPKSSRHASIDGAFFGSSFPHLLLSLHSNLIPVKLNDRYVPKLYGFRAHQSAELHRYQDTLRKGQMKSKDRQN